jgi:hypothetical protein
LPIVNAVDPADKNPAAAKLFVKVLGVPFNHIPVFPPEDIHKLIRIVPFPTEPVAIERPTTPGLVISMSPF